MSSAAVKHLKIGEGFKFEQTLYKSENSFFDKISYKKAEKRINGDNSKKTNLKQHSEHAKDDIDSFDERCYYEYIKHTTGRTFPPLQPSLTTCSINLVTEYSCPVSVKSRSEPKPKSCDFSLFLKQWKTDRDEIDLIRKLGQGYFGEVWYGKWRDSEVAVKMLREDTTMSNKEFLREAAIMKKIRHHRLVALYAVCSKEEPVYIVQEYMSKGSLVKFLRSDEGKILPINDLTFIAAQVAGGMAYLELKQIIHRDLAARNVVIGDEIIAKICDFGLARDIKHEDHFSHGIYQNKGSPYAVRWTAPEAINYGHFSIKSDVWSYGILLMELFTYGDQPYPGMCNEEVLEEIERGYRMPKSTSQYLPDSVYNVMLQCWNEDPHRRPTFDTLSLTISELLSRVIND